MTVFCTPVRDGKRIRTPHPVFRSEDISVGAGGGSRRVYRGAILAKGEAVAIGFDPIRFR